MKKGLLSIVGFLLGTIVMAQQYDFSAIAPTGQTLYYKIIDGEAQVTYQSQYANDGRCPYYYNPPTGDLTIPDNVTHNGTTYAVTSIDDHAFHACDGLTSVVIGNNVKKVGWYSFYMCGVTSVTLGNSVDNIGPSAFQYCTNLSSVIFPPSMISIGIDAFSECSSLVSLDLGTVYDIATSAFLNCTGLVSITVNIPANGSIGGFSGCTNLSSVTLTGELYKIRSNAFRNCSSLVNFEIPSSVEIIEDNAFYGCSSLQSIYIPYHTTEIGRNAFKNCTGLRYVYLGYSLSTINNEAFYGCTSLDSITCMAVNPPHNVTKALTFYSVDYSIPFFVPCESIELYRANNEWNSFTNFQCHPDPVSIEDHYENSVNITSGNHTIIINGVKDETVKLYAINGHILDSRKSENQQVKFKVPALGVYLVQVGTQPSKKVVVVD